MYNEKDRDKSGFNPYSPPNFTIDETKCIKYDDTGRIKAIVPVEKTQKEKIKLDFQRVKKYVIAFLVFCILMECYHYVRSYAPWKWKVEAFRPIIVDNLLKVSSASYYPQKFFNDFINEGKTPENMDNEDNQQIIRSLKSQVSRKSLLYKSPAEIEELLGAPETEESLNRANVSWQGNGLFPYDGDYEYEHTELYFAYSKKNYNYYMLVDYVCDISRAVSMMSFEINE
jgi:hypothetical protein